MPEASQPDWRAIAFDLAKFARHTKECHLHPFDKPCHCGYEAVWTEFKRDEAEYYLSTIEKPMSEEVKIDDGGPAFPGVWERENGDHAGGMALRDYFAAKAMQGMVGRMAFDQPSEDMLIKAGVKPDDFDSFVSKLAYDMADAMIAARKGAH